MIVVGKISVKAILESKKRDIETVYILDSKKDRESRYVLGLCKGLDVKRVSRENLDEITGVKSHGGYALKASSRTSDSMDDLVKSKAILCVEGVSDPFNMGEILRTVYSLGFDGFISPHYDFYHHEAKLIRASAGASEKITWLQSDDLVKDLKSLKENKFTLISAHRQDESISITEYEYDDKVVIMLGGALRGLSREVLDLSDDFVRVDYQNRMALSTQGAASVFAYSYFQQKIKE